LIPPIGIADAALLVLGSAGVSRIVTHGYILRAPREAARRMAERSLRRDRERSLGSRDRETLAVPGWACEALDYWWHCPQCTGLASGATMGLLYAALPHSARWLCLAAAASVVATSVDAAVAFLKQRRTEDSR